MSERGMYYGVLGMSMALTVSALAAGGEVPTTYQQERQPGHEFVVDGPPASPELSLNAGRLAVFGLEKESEPVKPSVYSEVPLAQVLADADVQAVEAVLENLPPPVPDLSFLNKPTEPVAKKTPKAAAPVQYEQVNAEGIPELVLCSSKDQWKTINTANAAIGREVAAEYGWVDAEFEALLELNACESSWDETADNPTTHAGGIPQALPKSKMASAGEDWETNPWTQLRWQMPYVAARYGTPSAALAHFKQHNWY